MKKPMIGVLPLVDVQRESLWMLPNYMDAVTASGGLPIMLPLTANPAELEQLCALCDGFLFTGGQDVDPTLYGAEKLPECGELSRERDAMEARLLRLAMAARKPIFGICRGIQVMNAALGGTLYQDLPSQHPSQVRHVMTRPYDAQIHTVTLSGSLAELLGTAEMGVNSLHHQAVRDIAPGMEVMAVAPDGIVEGMRLRNYPFLWAVQWHPEFSFRTDARSRKLFAAFLAACK